PEPGRGGREATRVQRAGGEGRLEIEQLWEAAQPAGDLHRRGRTTEQGAVHVEHVQQAHAGQYFRWGHPVSCEFDTVDTLRAGSIIVCCDRTEMDMQRAAFPELLGRPRPPSHRRPERSDRVLAGLKVATFVAAAGLLGVIILLIT